MQYVLCLNAAFGHYRKTVTMTRAPHEVLMCFRTRPRSVGACVENEEQKCVEMFRLLTSSLVRISFCFMLPE